MMNEIDLHGLLNGMPGLSKYTGGNLLEAASVSFVRQKHRSPVAMTVLGKWHEDVEVTFAEVTRQSMKSRDRIIAHGMEPFDESATRLADIPAQELQAAQAAMIQHRRAIFAYLISDVSRSMRGQKLEDATNGMLVFVGELVGDRGDAAGLISFSSSAQEIIEIGPLAEIHSELKQAILGLHAGGQTALVAAVRTGAEKLMTIPGDIVRALVVLTDGLENASSDEDKAVIGSLLQHAGTTGSPIICMGLAYGSDADTHWLEEFGRITGGLVLSGSPSTVFQVYEEIARHL